MMYKSIKSFIKFEDIDNTTDVFELAISSIWIMLKYIMKVQTFHLFF